MEWKWKKRNKTTFFGGEFKTRGHKALFIYPLITRKCWYDILFLVDGPFSAFYMQTYTQVIKFLCVLFRQGFAFIP